MINSVLAIAPIHQGLDYSPATDESGNDRYQQAIQWCQDLDAARAEKQYELADEIRKKLLDAGFEVRTTKAGTTIQKQLV